MSRSAQPATRIPLVATAVLLVALAVGLLARASVDPGSRALPSPSSGSGDGPETAVFALG